MSSELIVFPDGKTYRRSGECDGCARPGITQAQCCTYVLLPDRPLSTDEVNWLTLHPGLTVEVPRNVRIDVACGALEDGRCALFGRPERPQMCRNYPEHPDLDVGCAYVFEAVASGGGAAVMPR